MNQYPHPLIAREGWLFIGLATLLALISAHYWGYGSLLLWVIWGLVVQFFRDPPRTIPDVPNAVLSPADGKIVAVEKTIDPYRQVESMKVSVFMNVFNVHSNRIPVAATVKAVEYHKGQFLNAALDKSSLENERNALILETDKGLTLSCVQIAGLVARRILCYAKVGDRFTAGQRYGFIRFGSRVDVYLPLNARIQVVAGEKVKATSTILALL